jgi:hypothetical protein
MNRGKVGFNEIYNKKPTSLQVFRSLYIYLTVLVNYVLSVNHRHDWTN